MRAPQLLTWSLLGPPVVWADDEADRGLVLATTLGRTEVYAFDAATSPATLVQVTDPPDGTSGGSVSPDGSMAFWFDDSAGDEVGRWQRVPVSGGEGTTLLPALAPAYPGGIVPLPDGRVVIGRLIDVAPGDHVAFEVAVAGPDGDGTVVYQGSDPAEASQRATMRRSRCSASRRAATSCGSACGSCGLADGAEVGELFDDGLSLKAVGVPPERPAAGAVRPRAARPLDTRGVGRRERRAVQRHDGAGLTSPRSGTRAATRCCSRCFGDARHTLFRFDRRAAW